MVVSSFAKAATTHGGEILTETFDPPFRGILKLTISLHERSAKISAFHLSDNHRTRQLERTRLRRAAQLHVRSEKGKEPEMKDNAITILAMALVCVCAQHAPASETELSWGVGIMISPEYHDLLNDAYPDEEMYGGWLDLNLSVQRNIIKGLTLGPKVDVLTDFVFGDFINLVFLPGVSGRYTLKSLPSAYLRAEIDYGLYHSGSGRFDFQSDTVAYGGTVGYAFKNDWHMEAGYLEIPVDVTFEDPAEVRENVNLGGYILRVGKSF